MLLDRRRFKLASLTLPVEAVAMKDWPTHRQSLSGRTAADTGNYRALHYPVGVRFADEVWFQDGFTQLNPAINVLPNCVCFDRDSNMFFCSGNRVLFTLRSSPGVIARVYGQPNETANDPGLGPDRLSSPGGCSVMADGTVVIVDQGNNRIVFYQGNSTVGFKFLGQPDGFLVVPTLAEELRHRIKADFRVRRTWRSIRKEISLWLTHATIVFFFTRLGLACMAKARSSPELW